MRKHYLVLTWEMFARYVHKPTIRTNIYGNYMNVQVLVSICRKKKESQCNTYLVEPSQFDRSRIRPDVAFEVNIGALLDVFRIQGGAHLQAGDRRDCNQNRSRMLD